MTDGDPAPAGRAPALEFGPYRRRWTRRVVRERGSSRSDASQPSRYEIGADIPDRVPDEQVTDQTLPIQALLYRCSGDANIIHTDPSAARSAGFPGPILQGLCTLGFAARALLRTVCAGDTNRFAAVDCRFVSPGFPGYALTTSMWRLAPDRVAFRTVSQTGGVLIDRGVLETSRGAS